jgi:hypothetical protein
MLLLQENNVKELSLKPECADRDSNPGLGVGNA